MFKRRFATITGEFFKGLEPDFLGNVLNFAFAAGVTASGGEDARRILLNQRLETRGVPPQHRGNQLRLSSFHGAIRSGVFSGPKAKTV